MSISLGLSCLEFSCLPGSVSLFPSSFLGKFSAIISSNMISASFLLSLPPGSSLNWALVHLILSHKTLKVSPIFFFFIFLYLCLIWWVPSTCLWVHGFVLFSHPVWVNSGSWWWTGRPGVLHLMGSQRVGHNCATELNWTEGRIDQQISSPRKSYSFKTERGDNFIYCGKTNSENQEKWISKWLSSKWKNKQKERCWNQRAFWSRPKFYKSHSTCKICSEQRKWAF